MAVVTITRTPWIDDDGSGTYGTVINNAEKTLLYNQIDTALAQLLPLSGGTLTGSLSVTGAVTMTGSLTVGPSAQIRNTAPTSRTDLYVGNDTAVTAFDLVTYGSTYASQGGYDVPNGTLLYQGATGGLTYYVAGPGTHRFYTAGVERARITAAGELVVNGTTPAPNTQMTVYADNSSHTAALSLMNIGGGLLYYMFFLNNSAGAAGSIQQTGAGTVAYNTTSDARLKDDDGPASDLSALRAVVVHDFRWKDDAVRDRGVFAQETYPLYPRAVSRGDDSRTADGALARPWMTDYSKFVADLIVGWQQHDAELVALRAELAHMKGMN